MSRVLPAARSSGASCTRASAVRARSRSGSRAPGVELAGELDPDNLLDLAAHSAVELLEAGGASIRLLEGDEVVGRAAAGEGELASVGARTPSTAWLVGDIVQTRSTRAIADVRRDARIGDADAMLAAGYAAYLGVPMVGPDGFVQGILAVYSMRPRVWRPEEEEVLLALAATATQRAHERRALPGREPGAAAERGDPRQRRRRHRRRRSRGQGRALEPRRRAGDGRSAERRTRADADRGARSATRGRGGHLRRQPARADPARRRRGVALAQRGRDERPGRRRRGPDLRLPRHLCGTERRADEVGFRLDRLARAAHAAHLDLRLRRDAAARRRQLRRGRACDLPALHRIGVRTVDVDRRPPALRRPARHRRHGGADRGDRCGARS